MNQTTSEMKFDRRINHAPDDFDVTRDLPKGFAEFFTHLHKEFTLRQQRPAQKRAEVLSASKTDSNRRFRAGLLTRLTPI